MQEIKACAYLDLEKVSGRFAHATQLAKLQTPTPPAVFAAGHDISTALAHEAYLRKKYCQEIGSVMVHTDREPDHHACFGRLFPAPYFLQGPATCTEHTASSEYARL